MWQVYHNITDVGKGTDEYESYEAAYVGFATWLASNPTAPYYISVIDPNGSTVHEVSS